jgi:hypothetical protein
MKCLIWIEIDDLLDRKTQAAAHFDVKYCYLMGERVQKVSISGFLSENAPSVHPDIGHQIFLYKFLTFILPDLRINSPNPTSCSKKGCQKNVADMGIYPPVPPGVK